MSEKEQIFWDALMEKNNSKKSKYFKKFSKQIDCKHLAEQFSVETSEVERVLALFLVIDDDKSGAITATEIAQSLSSLGCNVSPKIVQAVMRTTDKNGDGEINFEEFLAVVISKSKLRKNKNQMNAICDELDSSASVTHEMLANAWLSVTGLKLNPYEANAMIAQAEATCREVTKNNFLRMWRNI